MELDFLQKKYPEFIYKSFSWEIAGPDLRAAFVFGMGDIEFTPNIVIRGVNASRIALLDKSVVDNLIFNMGLAEMPSYWKAACPPRIVIDAGYLDKNQVSFWRDLIANMGQFFYENNLAFIRPEFRVNAPKNKKPVAAADELSNRFLVPLGGGKDSLVTLEMIKQELREKPNLGAHSGEKVITFTLNANPALTAVATAAGAKNICVERKIDPRLLELNKLGYFNGHTPFSSILAVLGVALGVLFDCRYVAISQERSSNEGNMVYRGKKINHQYTKTIDFENKFRAYSKKYLTKEADYFSYLRPLYEFQIAMLFSSYPQYFDTFLSCNKAYTIANRQNNAGWCGNCAKCLSVFSMLYPFLGEAGMMRVFRQDLFKNAGLLPLMREMLGEAACKPFECIGTINETRAAFNLSLNLARKETPGGLPVLLQIFENQYLPNYRNIEKETVTILSGWENKNNLPKGLQIGLKNTLKSATLDKI